MKCIKRSITMDEIIDQFMRKSIKKLSEKIGREEMKRVKGMFYDNAQTIPCQLGSRKHGHLIIMMRDNDCNTEASEESILPVNPGIFSVFPDNLAQCGIAVAKEKDKRQLQLIKH